MPTLLVLGFLFFVVVDGRFVRLAFCVVGPVGGFLTVPALLMPAFLGGVGVEVFLGAFLFALLGVFGRHAAVRLLMLLWFVIVLLVWLGGGLLVVSQSGAGLDGGVGLGLDFFVFAFALFFRVLLSLEQYVLGVGFRVVDVLALCGRVVVDWVLLLLGRRVLLGVQVWLVSLVMLVLPLSEGLVFCELVYFCRFFFRGPGRSAQVFGVFLCVLGGVGLLCLRFVLQVAALRVVFGLLVGVRVSLAGPFVVFFWADGECLVGFLVEIAD
ncbi:hypothetical protein [Metapseudomonas resinovorans]|uniref:hypothetical protein n=1 Tax=Metapseudomonas resinovorans TaxID=53412 RepID=UPI000490FE7F|nr:hypothetical protein [Pseudomonas resinovorans]